MMMRSKNESALRAFLGAFICQIRAYFMAFLPFILSLRSGMNQPSLPSAVIVPACALVSASAWRAWALMILHAFRHKIQRYTSFIQSFFSDLAAFGEVQDGEVWDR